ncbi:hypothetical protein KM043_014947 [Ampulex compressa]|nr:hypothetical protein KM043_014947 [Ampulex compressa]
MADKIKSFFKKKKADAKFMNAGKGYKLTDQTSSAVLNQHAERPQLIQRAEPTEEAKIAGQAALARLEAKAPTLTRFDTSYMAIQARVKRELEMERKALQTAQEESNAESQKNTKCDIENEKTMAVTEVFFRCPYMSNEILTWAEWKIKIKEFLYEELKGEEAGLTSCLIIQNCNTKREKVDSCIDTLVRYLDNITNNPDVEKYRKIRMCNRIFQEKVLPIEGALDFLMAAGFEKQKLMNNDQEEDFLIWNPEKCSIDDLIMLTEALKNAEPIPIELDRNLQVLLPYQAMMKNQLPSTFFTMTPEEIKREQQIRAEAVERNQMLRTKAMREKDEQRELRKYKFALIRIKFPDNIILQGTFSVHEKLHNVFEFVKENIKDSEAPFSLMPLGMSKLEGDSMQKTLLELKLIPAVVLLFNWRSSSAQDNNQSVGYLKEEVLCYVQSM